MLEILQEITRLKVNFHKSQLLGIHMQGRATKRAALILGCTIDDFPISYLGLPLSRGAMHCREWQPTIDKFEAWLEKKAFILWREDNSLQVCFGQSAGVLPLYFRSPCLSGQKLQSIQSRFFWNCTVDKVKGWDDINWGSICQDRRASEPSIWPCLLSGLEVRLY